MLCCAVGAGDSLLLLLGDSVESKGRISFPRLLFCCPCGGFLPGQSEDGALWFGAVEPLFFLSGGSGGLRLHDAERN